MMWNTHKLLVGGLAFLIFSLLTSGSLLGSVTVENLSYNSLLYLNGDFSKAGSSAAVDMKNGSKQLMVLGVDFKGTVQANNVTSVVVESLEIEQKGVAAAVLGKPLFYPNPAKQADNPKLWYVLSKNMDIEIQIYDMMSNMILQSEFVAGSQGAKAGTNWLSITDNTFDQHKLSAGVYFVLIMNAGKVLGKGKVAILP